MVRHGVTIQDRPLSIEERSCCPLRSFGNETHDGDDCGTGLLSIHAGRANIEL
jgi:hypothetical protein